MKEGTILKRILSLLAALLLALCLACSGNRDAQDPSTASPADPATAAPASPSSPQPEARVLSGLEQLDVWSLPDRYDSSYTTIHYTVTYEHDGTQFMLTISRSKKDLTGSRFGTRNSKELDGVAYTLYENKDEQSGTVTGTFYEAFTGAFRYRIGSEAYGIFMEDHLSMDDVIALFASPLAPRDGITLIDTEWDVYLRPEGCNLEIVILPSDGGRTIRKLDSDFTAREEDGETVYVSGEGNEIAYTDGTSSVRIRQTNRSGGGAANYLTLTECKALLAVLGIQ